MGSCLTSEEERRGDVHLHDLIPRIDGCGHESAKVGIDCCVVDQNVDLTEPTEGTQVSVAPALAAVLSERRINEFSAVRLVANVADQSRHREPLLLEDAHRLEPGYLAESYRKAQTTYLVYVVLAAGGNHNMRSLLS